MFFVFIKSLWNFVFFIRSVYMYLYELRLISITFWYHYIDFITFWFRYMLLPLHWFHYILISLHFYLITMILFCDFTGNNSWNHLWTINCGTCSSESWPMVPGVYHCCRRELCWCYYLPKSECSKSSAVGKWMFVQIDPKKWSNFLNTGSVFQPFLAVTFDRYWHA